MTRGQSAYGLGRPITEENGRVRCGGEDWGAVITRGDALPCCGCTLAYGAGALICDDCYCHDQYRWLHGLPPRVTVNLEGTETQ